MIYKNFNGWKNYGEIIAFDMRKKNLILVMGEIQKAKYHKRLKKLWK